MVMGLIGAGLGVAAPLLMNAAGIGKNDTRAKTFDESSAYDPHAYQYGGTAGGADKAANDFGIRADQAQQRQGAQAGLVGVDPRISNAWMTNNAQDRTQQNQVARMMMARAQGLVPSIASQQAALDMQRAGAAQSSAAASARGSAGLALAGQNAANNTATMQSAISSNAQVNAANERLAAEQGAYGAYSGIRSGDAQMQQAAAQQAQYNAQLGAQQNQYNAGLAQQQHGLNDAYSANMYGQMNNVRQMQLNGGIASQGLLGTSQMNATNQNVAISGANANVERGYYQQALGALGGGLTGAGQMMSSGPPAPPPPVPPAPVTGVGAGGSTNMVGIPQAGAGSDDRMKSGVTPLGLLGFGSSNMNPTSGPAASSYEVLSGGGENVGASGQAMNAAAMQYQTDPTSYGDGPGAHPGMMSGGGLLSDDRAKRAAYTLGRFEGMQQAATDEEIPYAVGSPLSDGEELIVGRNGPEIRPNGLGTTRIAAQRGRAQQPVGFDRDAGYFAAPAPAPARAPAPSMAGSMLDRDAAQGQPAPVSHHYSESDPVTEQFAQGLAPIRFQYRPGMGPGGEQTGVRAQAAASQPVTSSMVTKRPDGLLQLDPQMGLGTALAGVGHLAKKQQDNEAKFNGLLAMAAQREGY